MEWLAVHRSIPVWRGRQFISHEDRWISRDVSILRRSWSIPDLVEDDMAALTARPICIELRVNASSSTKNGSFSFWQPVRMFLSPDVCQLMWWVIRNCYIWNHLKQTRKRGEKRRIDHCSCSGVWSRILQQLACMVLIHWVNTMLQIFILKSSRFIEILVRIWREQLSLKLACCSLVLKTDQFLWGDDELFEQGNGHPLKPSTPILFDNKGINSGEYRGSWESDGWWPVR